MNLDLQDGRPEEQLVMVCPWIIDDRVVSDSFYSCAIHVNIHQVVCPVPSAVRDLGKHQYAFDTLP